MGTLITSFKRRITRPHSVVPAVFRVGVAVTIPAVLLWANTSAQTEAEMALGASVLSGQPIDRLPFGGSVVDGMGFRLVLNPEARVGFALDFHSWRAVHTDTIARGNLLVQVNFSPGIQAVRFGGHASIGYARAEYVSNQTGDPTDGTASAKIEDGPVIGIGAEIWVPRIILPIRIASDLLLQGLSGGHRTFTTLSLGLMFRFPTSQ